MQCTAADLIKLAMIAVDRWLAEHRLDSRLVMQAHDELVIEVPGAEIVEVRTQLSLLMGQVAQLAVPLVVDVGSAPNWDQAH